VGTRCADHVTLLYPQKLALTSSTGGGRSVGIVRSRTKATEFSFSFSWPNCWHPLCCGCSSRQESSETVASVEQVSQLSPVSESLSSGTEKLPADSRQKLQAAARLLTGSTALRTHMFTFGLTQRQDCRLCGENGKVLCMLCVSVTVRHWPAENTGRWVVCSGRLRI
jgi:hypothetical protein